MSDIENYIKNIYESIYINDPQQLTIENIASQLNLDIYYWEFTSGIVECKGKYKMFINEKLSRQGQWQDFGHEIKHYFYDRGSRLYIREQFVDYLESKADYFSYHFCIPTFMLMNLKGVDVYDVMRLFNVEFEFALRRLEMYKNKVLTRSNSKIKVY